MKFLKRMAYKFHSNNFLKVIFRPIWHKYWAYKDNERKKMFRKNALMLLKTASETLNKKDVFFWLDFGTLLGAYREHDFIKHDFDLDIAAFYKDHELIKSSLCEAGFVLLREYISGDGLDGYEQTFEFKGVTIDIFYYFIDNDKSMYCNTFSYFDGHYPNPDQFETVVQVKKVIVPNNGFTKILFQGLEFNVPAKTEKYLAAHYGENFMIPNAHFDYKKDAKNVYFYSREERTGICRHWESKYSYL